MGTDMPTAETTATDETRPAPGAVGPARGVPILEMRGIFKSFGPKRVLCGVDLEVSRSEVVALLGPNGCGKSTLLRCVNLLESYDAGCVLLDGRVVSAAGPNGVRLGEDGRGDARDLRRRVGMVFQRFNLFPHMTVLQNVMAGPIHARGLGRDEAREVAERMLRRVGLWEKHPCDPLTLSGGQQQRAAIARSLAMNPEILLLDEATSALDPVMTKEVFRVIRELAADGMTMLLVTHDVDFARDVADRAAFMEAGRITAQGALERVLGDQASPAVRRFIGDAGA